MTTMNHHDARGPEETMHDLPPVVPAKCASRNPSPGVHQAGMSGRSTAEDAGELAQPEPGLRHRLEARQARDAGNTAGGSATIAGAFEATSLGVRERPVRSARR